MSEREIPRHPIVPTITSDLQERLTELCFGADRELASRIDVLFIFGSTHGLDLLAAVVERAFKSAQIDQVVIAGGHPYDQVLGQPEAANIYKAIQNLIPIGIQVKLETESRHTLDNARYGLRLLQQAPQTLAFVCKNYHVVRSELTLRQFVSSGDLYPLPYGFIDKDNWASDEQARARVWGEYLRIQKYGGRGDIAYPLDVAKRVSEIESIVGVYPHGSRLAPG